MEEEDEGITRRMKGSSAGMNEEDEEEITLKLFFKK